MILIGMSLVGSAGNIMGMAGIVAFDVVSALAARPASRSCRRLTLVTLGRTFLCAYRNLSRLITKPNYRREHP